jgi:hypothetical protein
MLDSEMEVLFSDLSPEIQEWLLEAYGVSSPDEMNWGIFPVFTLYAPGAEPDDEDDWA